MFSVILSSACGCTTQEQGVLNYLKRGGQVWVLIVVVFVYFSEVWKSFAAYSTSPKLFAF